MFPEYLNVEGQIYSRYPHECVVPDNVPIVDVYDFLKINPSNIHNLPGRLLFDVCYTDKVINEDMESVVSGRTTINPGDFFRLTDKSGRSYTMVMETVYGYVDCISIELIGPTAIRQRLTDNVGGPDRNTALNYYLDYYFRTEFPPILKKYVMPKELKVPTKRPGSLDSCIRNTVLGPLWIPYGMEVGLFGLEYPTGDLKQYEVCNKYVKWEKTFNGEPSSWWTYSPVYQHSDTFWYATSDGCAYDRSNSEHPIPLCFRLDTRDKTMQVL